MPAVVRRTAHARPASAAVTAVLLALSAAGTADSAGAASSPIGRLTVFARPDFTGTSTAISYGACAGELRIFGHAAAFNNVPLSGCRIVLINRSGQGSLVLCEGRGVIPEQLRQSPRIRLDPGTAPACPITMHR